MPSPTFLKLRLRSTSLVFRLAVLAVATLLLASVGLVTGLSIQPAKATSQPTLLPASGQFKSITPDQVLNTSSGLGETSAQPLAAGATINVSVVGSGGAPTSATAVVANVHAKDPVASGYISDNSTDTPDVGAPSLGFRAGENSRQIETIQIGADGEVYLTNHSSGSVDLEMTILGYFKGAAATVAGDTYFGVPWQQIADSTTGLGTTEAPIPANGSRTIQVGGQGGIANGADSTVIQVNAFNASTDGSLDVYPAGGTDPGVPALRYHSDDLYRTLYYTNLSSSGKITVTNTGTAAVDFTIWTRGYFMPPTTSPAGSEYTVMDPVMAYGTTSSGTTVGADSSVTFQVTGTNGIPSSGVTEVDEDVAVTSPTATGSLQIGAADSTTHAAVNFLGGDTTDVGADNTILTEVSPSGQETVTNNSSGSLQLQVAIRGYYLASSAPQAPASVTATTSGGSATISWAAPARDGGTPITGYTVSASPDTAQATVDPGTFQATLTGLSHTATDTFTVIATNATGTSPASTYQPVTPATVEDTLTSGSPVAAGANVTFAVGGTNGLPTYGVGEAGMNVTVENEAASGSVAITPGGSSSNSSSPLYFTPSMLNFSASTPVTALKFVPTGTQGNITLTNSSSGNVDINVQLVGWSNASAVIPVSEQSTFVSDVESIEGSSAADIANLAIYDDPLAGSLATSEVLSSNDPVESITTSDPDTPLSESSSGTDSGSITSPGIPITYNDGEFDTFYSSSSCPSGSNPDTPREASITRRAANIFDSTLFKTTFHVVWCINKTTPKVTAVLRVNVLPDYINDPFGWPWVYAGLVAGTSDNVYFWWGGNSHGGHHSYRQAHWEWCAGGVLGVGCAGSWDVKENINVHGDGTHRFFRGNDQIQ